MRSKFTVYLILIVSFFMAQPPAYSYTETFTTGKDWVEKMSKKEKFISIFAPMILFHRYGVSFQKTPEEYIHTIDKVLLYNPYLEKEDVANLFASTVYATEPESRPAIEEMHREFKYRHGENELITPRLLLQPSTDQPAEQS